MNPSQDRPPSLNVDFHEARCGGLIFPFNWRALFDSVSKEKFHTAWSIKKVTLCRKTCPIKSMVSGFFDI